MKVIYTLVAAGFVATSASAQSVNVGFGHVELNVVDAHLFIDGQKVFGPFTVRQETAGFLFFYVPGRGLYTIGAERFEGARQSGEFQGRRLEMEVSGARVRLESATRMLGRRTQDAWVRYQPDFKLNVQGVMYGYGDDPSAAERWLEQFGAAER